ncbi:MAG TPA: PQQ-binding-like beta-propeller repeat protein [Stellaceae bacterium]|nr:PQQ-binding-like beta-propeller repeat protein [Stellaceae bacterium]
MNRREFGALLLASTAAGCGLFGGDKKTPLPGERISVLGLDRRVAPDPALANLGVTLPRPVVNPDWPEPGGYPNHAMYHLGLPPSLTRAWETSVGDGSSRYRKVMSQPIIVRDTVFAMDGGTQLSAVAAGNGSSIWQVELKPEGMKGNAFGGGPAFWKDRLYVATGYAEVLALDPANGNVIWRKPVDAPVHAAPTVADGRIYAVTVENELIVLATEDGRRLWTHNGIPETAGLLGGASPAVEGEIVVVAYNSGELFALRVENGRVLWSENLAAARNVDPVSGLADIRGRPVIDRDRVFAISHSGRMAAIDLRRGDRVWEREIASSHGPWVAGDFIYVLANDSELACLTRNEGKVRWAQQLPRYDNPEKREDPILWAGPVLGGDRVIALSSTGDGVSVSPYTGEPTGRITMSAGGYLGPVIAGNTLYLLTDDANLSAYR